MVALLLFLYGTGLTVGEALGAKREHLDLKQSSLRVAGVSSRPNRILPLGADVKALLEWHLKISLTGPETNRPLFATKNADSINHRTLAITFRRLCTLAKVSRRLDARYQPRLHDFRHTFAVHRIVRWFREGADVRKMLPLLAAFMGMVTVTATDGYLLLAPARYRKQIRRVG
jgi:site-specific recombinase XerD